MRFICATMLAVLGALQVTLALLLAEIYHLSLSGNWIRLCPEEAWTIAVAFAGGIFIFSSAVGMVLRKDAVASTCVEG